MTTSVPDWRLPIELGAEFVHDRPSPLLAFQHGALELVTVRERRGLVEQGRVRPLPDAWSRFAQLIAPAERAGAAQSLRDYLTARALASQDEELVRLIVEDYHAAPLDDVSARAMGRAASELSRGFKQHRPAGGYRVLAQDLMAELERYPVRLELGARVRRIEWSSGQVKLLAERRDQRLELTVPRCVIAVSIGALANGSIELHPVPKALPQATRQLAMGQVVKVVLRFENSPWPGSAPDFTFVHSHSPAAPFTTFWFEASGEQHQITAWVGGPRAAPLSGRATEELAQLALEGLSSGLNVPLAAFRDSLRGAHHHDFTQDPAFAGAYAYVRAGGIEAASKLAEPVQNTLFFAGEALDIEYPGTVPGALGSGQHTARKLIASLFLPRT
jgi:monoamine oxidase